MIDWVAAIGVLNVAAVVVFLVLLGATTVSMLRRMLLYRRAKLPLPTLLKRGLVLFSALSLLSGETVLLRVMNSTFFLAPSLERFLFILQFDLIFLGALAYYTKTELTDIDDEDKP